MSLQPATVKRRVSQLVLRALAVSLLAFLLCGCKLSTPPSQPQVLSSALPPTTVIPPHWTSLAVTNGVANDWLKSFNDFRLDALVAEAITNNLDLRQAAESEVKRILELLLGRYPAAEIEVAGNFAPVPPTVPAGLPSSLLGRRPDILAVERQVLAAFRRKEAARLAVLPSFNLGLEGGRLENNLLSLLQLNPWLLHAAVGMTIPIYTGGELLARIAIATARQQAAVATYGGVALRAFREAENALTNEDLLAQRLQFDQAALRNRTEAVRICRIQYTAGATDLISVLQLQADQIAGEVAVIKLRNEQLANRVNLHLALGGSFEAAPAVAQGE